MSVSGVSVTISVSEHQATVFKPVVKQKKKAASQYIKQDAMAKRPLSSASPGPLPTTGPVLLFAYAARFVPDTQFRDTS